MTCETVRQRLMEFRFNRPFDAAKLFVFSDGEVIVLAEIVVKFAQCVGKKRQRTGTT